MPDASAHGPDGQLSYDWEIQERHRYPWSDLLPVSVNDTYGDPFIPEQVDNTISKLARLRTHRAPIAIFTKAGYDTDVLRRLEAVRDNVNVVVFYSLTGLNEAGISFSDRVAMIDGLLGLWKNVVVFTRPIIRNRNDDPATLQRLVDVAAGRTKLLVMGGLHDRYKNKQLQFAVEDTLTAMCDEQGVKCFHKTACCAAHLHGRSCWVHRMIGPVDVDVALQLGYRLAVDGTRLVLDRASTGDLNFLRMLTRTQVYTRQLISNYNLLTIPSGDQKYEATSSWFAWSENIGTCLDCDYCIIKQIEYLKKMQVKIGTHPSEMTGIVRRSNPGVDFSDFVLTKLRPEWTEAHVYDDVRVVKPCFTERYELVRPDHRPRVEVVPS
jgi:hypothetical protein